MDKLYIIGIRYNPQLGSYLSKAVVAASKVNKTCISAKFDDYGSATVLKFSLQPNINGRHYCKSAQQCAYGDYEYIGFSDKAKAIEELQKWLNVSGCSSERAKAGIQKFEAA